MCVRVCSHMCDLFIHARVHVCSHVIAQTCVFSYMFVILVCFQVVLLLCNFLNTAQGNLQDDFRIVFGL